MTLGSMLTQARGLRTRRDVADALGVDVVTVGRWETDARIPETGEMERVLGAYQVPRRLWADALEAAATTAQGRVSER